MGSEGWKHARDDCMKSRLMVHCQGLRAVERPCVPPPAPRPPPLLPVWDRGQVVMPTKGSQFKGNTRGFSKPTRQAPKNQGRVSTKVGQKSTPTSTQVLDQRKRRVASEDALPLRNSEHVPLMAGSHVNAPALYCRYRVSWAPHGSGLSLFLP